ncbi:hypothetical protein SODALDRAFT_328688 [Sodiomyces alkalinus F11]|uniref:Uncharacterized protein n=1 Tax=Sodiomyces alkalinus (strain CBS 110278 / VKM F-3762 / F11) TaxID=1314773 RepID=A0A3N2PLJ9_SODAK|nr:hypothetical protein SODALDRAFT_328688 [Sodiomyces alkalinus F11]ROT35359.1 hypothetical protein SODALDRAFT_328688 [Sodiomyces alkalinus F11]
MYPYHGHAKWRPPHLALSSPLAPLAPLAPELSSCEPTIPQVIKFGDDKVDRMGAHVSHDGYRQGGCYCRCDKRL